MSFSSKVKYEAAAHLGGGRHCHIAELAAIVNHCGIVSESGSGGIGGYQVFVHSDNELVIVKLIKLMGMVFNYNCEKLFFGENLREAVVRDGETAKRLLMATGLLTEALTKSVSPGVTKLDCCKRSYIRGAFLSAGSVSDPESSYHIEFACESGVLANGLESLLAAFGLKPKTVGRKSYIVAYLKEADQIADALNIIGAHSSLLEFENARVTKQVSNNINRVVNFSNANDSKTIEAAVRHANEIRYIEESAGLAVLPPHLRKLAELRLEFPELSLKELGEKLNPPLTKSGVNHRLKKIKAMVEKIKTSEL